MAIFARPYDVTRSVENNMKLVDAFVASPQFLTYPQDPDTARQIGIWMLTNPGHVVFEAWRDKELAGVMLLTRVMPKVDALLHFMFLDKDLVGKRKLLQNFIGFCFTDLGFNRLSMEVPEGVRLERFCRKVLFFKYEGESRPRNPELPKALSDTWVARQGSRIEGGYFDGKTWKDILRLRLLACEWVDGKEGECQSDQSSEPLPHQSPEQ